MVVIYVSDTGEAVCIIGLSVFIGLCIKAAFKGEVEQLNVLKALKLVEGVA